MRAYSTCHGVSFVQILCFIFGKLNFLSPAGAVGPGDGRYCNAPRLSVCLSVTFSFRTITQKAVFSRNFAGMCTKSWGCAV